MIQEFVDSFMERKAELADEFAKMHPVDYREIVAKVVSVLSDDEWSGPDPERIVEINYGSYQGVLVYVIAERGYQPRDYWYVRVDYGSCSGCDTLERIRLYSDDQPTSSQVSDYMTLALHVVQQLKKMDGEIV